MVGVSSFALQMGHWKFTKIIKLIIVKLKNGNALALHSLQDHGSSLTSTFSVLSICKPRTILMDPKVALCMQNCLLSVGGILTTFEACVAKTKLTYKIWCIIFVHKQGLI